MDSIFRKTGIGCNKIQKTGDKNGGTSFTE
jgi:hypothetical protein